ncbi:MAG: class I SAM-dependent methyltransferase [Actinomycetota bacterium]
MTRDPESESRIVEDQITYYERRAPEYDETSGLESVPLDELAAAVDDFGPRGRILEVACGTGTWTSRLLAYSDDVTALDSSPRMLELNRRRVNNPRVRYAAVDVFEWEPDGLYDVVFFAFWLSHVPTARFESFWDVVSRALAPQGRVFFMDEGAHDRWHEEVIDPSIPLVRRRLRDGSEHRVVKALWEPEELEDRLRGLGWDVTVTGVGAFYWGAGGRAS